MLKLITPYASDFGNPNVIIKHFPDTESYVLIPKISSLKNKKITIYHQLYPEPEKRIFELLLILSRVKEKTKDIKLFVPYLPYARQDRENIKGEALSADMLCGLLKSSGVKKLITYDCHFLLRPGNFTRNGLRIENMSAGKQLLAHAKKHFAKVSPGQEFCVVSPDQGASYFTDNAQGFAMSKKRRRTEEHGLESEIHSMDCEENNEKYLKGKNVCILDDIIASGGTIIHAIGHLKKLGAKQIIVGATHGIFCGDKIAKKILKSSCSEIFVMNSILNQDKAVKVLNLEI
jgi:ribose-phosphate pyrophosphokinase